MRILFYILFLPLIVSCNNSYVGGEVSLRLDGFPFFISNKIYEIYMTNDLIIIELGEADSKKMKLYAEEVHTEGNLLSLYVNDDVYIENIAIAPSSGAPWTEIKLPRLKGAVEFFEQHGVRVIHLETQKGTKKGSGTENEELKTGYVVKGVRKGSCRYV